MGVAIVLCTVENKPHVSSHHFAIFPNGLLGYLISVLFDCTFAVSLTLHFIHNQFSHLQISLHFIYLIQKPTHWAPNLHQFSKQTAPSPAQPYYIGAPIFVFVHSSQIILYSFDKIVKSLCFQHLHNFLLSPLATFFFLEKQPMSSLVGELTIFHSS